MSSTNVVRDTTGSDYLNNLRLTNQQIQAGNTAQTNFTPLYIIQEGDTIDITDAVSNNSNVQTQSDTIDITDTVSEVDYPAGASSLAGNSFKKLWLQFNNDVLDNSTNGNDGSVTYHSNLKGLWFSSDYGSLNDATLNGNNGTITGNINYHRGKEGTAFKFDGSSYVSIPDNAGLEPTAFSVSFWVYLTSTQPAFTHYIRKYSAGSNGQWFVDSGSGTTSNIRFGVDTSTGEHATATTTLSLNTWYHIVCTYDGTNNANAIIMYVNSVSSQTATASGTWTPSGNTQPILIGGSNPLTGYMNQVRFYNIVLSQAQISALKMSGVIGSCHTFDGGEYVTCPSSAIVTGATNRSVSLWIYPTLFVDAKIIYFWGATSSENAFFLQLSGTSGNILASLFGDDLTSTTTLTLNTWNHVVVTLNGTTLTIYINSVASGTKTTGTPNTTSSSLYIGASNSGASNLTAQIDDLQIWNNYVLSQAEINYLYAKKDGWQVEEDADFQPLMLSFDNDYVDKSGNNNVGTLTGTETYVSGPKTKNVFSFNGSSYITYNSILGNFERTQSFSVAFWLKTSTSTSTLQGIIQKKTNWDQTGWGIENQFNTLYFRLTNTSSTNEIVVHGPSLVNSGYWHHYVVTYDGSSTGAGVKWYVDGVAVTNTIDTNNLSASILNSNSVTVGSFIAGVSELTGSVGDVQIWNYVLAQSDINSLVGGQQITHNSVVPTPEKSDFIEVVA